MAMFRNALLALTTLAFACHANADSLVLISQTGGQYDYGIHLDANQGIVFTTGDSITLSDLAGLTGAGVSPNLAFLFTSLVTTPTSATMVATSSIVLDPIGVSQTLNAVIVDSTVLTSGSINYQIQTGATEVTGTVMGPVVSMPEPQSLALIADGMLAFFGWRLRHRAA